MKQWTWLVIAAAAACRGSAPAAPADPQPDPRGDQAGLLAPGDYGCSFGGYPEFLCRVTADGDARVLEKLGGTDRYRGTLAAADDGVRWINDAPDGTPPAMTFQRDGDDAWRAEIATGEEPMVYRLRYLGALGSQFGGEAYAGAIAEPSYGSGE